MIILNNDYYLLLSVLPVLSVNITFSSSSIAELWYERIGIGILALFASFFVTTAYHLGYPEFCGNKVVWANVGNGILSLAYKLTLNPLAAILTHMGMHVAAMVHGLSPRTSCIKMEHTVCSIGLKHLTCRPLFFIECSIT